MKKTILIITLFLSVFSSYLTAQTRTWPGDIMGIWSVVDFDTNSNYIHIDTSSQNIWQIGRPQKNIFDSAYSVPNAIITDTLNVYPTNNYSFFDLYVGDFNHLMYPWNLFFDFWHKYNTDTLKDGGFITVSWDKGVTWANIIHDTNSAVYVTPSMPIYVPTPNLYTNSDTLFNGEFGFSGNSNGWIHTTFAWHELPVKTIQPSDTMILRFNFISDNIQTNKAGWMIDQIRLFSVDLGGGVHNLLNQGNQVVISPNPFSESTEITFSKPFKVIDVEIFDIQGKLVKQAQYSSYSRIQLNGKEFENGIYFLKFRIDNDYVISQKIIVNH
jgi:hypothetical protein